MHVKFKISIAQLLCLLAIAGSLSFLATLDDDEPIWRDDLLDYQTPEVPPHFQMLSAAPFESELPSNLAARNEPQTMTFRDSSEMYLRCHRDGWMVIRRLFYEQLNWRTDIHEYDFYEDYDYSKLSFRLNQDWIQLANWEGARLCRSQLNELLVKRSATELKAKLAYSPRWRKALPLLILVVSVFGLRLAR